MTYTRGVECDIDSAMVLGLLTREEAAEWMAELGYAPEEIQDELIANGLMVKNGRAV